MLHKYPSIPYLPPGWLFLDLFQWYRDHPWARSDAWVWTPPGTPFVPGILVFASLGILVLASPGLLVLASPGILVLTYRPSATSLNCSIVGSLEEEG